MTRVRERRRQSCVACRFVHEVQYHTMISITAVAATGEERVSPHRPPCVYNRSVVHQSTAEKPTHQQSTIPPCAYNNRTAVQQKHKRKRRDRMIQLTLCLSRIERSNVEPTEHIFISCRLREGNLKKSSLAEVGCDARSYAGLLCGWDLARSRCLEGSGGTREQPVLKNHTLTQSN